MEEEPKLWQNVTYIIWKVGAPGWEVGLALTVVTTSHKEFEHKRMVVDISNEALIKYLASNLDDNKVEDDSEDSDGNLPDMLADGEGEDDSNDDEDVNDNAWWTVLEVANKTDDSGFQSSVEDGSRIKVLSGIGTQWTATLPSYQLGMSEGSSSFQSSCPAGQLSAWDIASGMSFNQFVQRTAQTSGIRELMGGQSALSAHFYCPLVSFGCHKTPHKMLMY